MSLSSNSVNFEKVKDGVFLLTWNIFLIDERTLELWVPEVFFGFETSIVYHRNCTVVPENNFIEMKFTKAIIKPCKLETIIVHAAYETSDIKRIRNNSLMVSYDDLDNQKKMEFCQSKWTTSWRRTTQRIVKFHIVIIIDFSDFLVYDSEIYPAKRRVKHVIGQLSNLWENKTMSDVTFYCQGKSFEAHICIIASGSPVFAAMFQHDFKEKKEKVVEIKDIPPKIFENLLRYIYTGEAFVEGSVDEDVEDLFAAADKYDIEALKEDCAYRMQQNLTVENAALYLFLAQRHHSPKLSKLSLEFMNATVCI